MRTGDPLLPMRTRTLLWQLAVLAGAEVLLYRSYAVHVAQFHWATHFLVGVTAAALFGAVFLLVAGRPLRLQLAPVLAFHLWAMWPDLAFRAGVPHAGWMDPLALGHISSHHLPGADRTWLALALVAAGGYAVLLSRWVAAGVRS